MEDINNIDLLSIERNWIQPSAGKILISKPFTGEEHFQKSVVYLAKHDDEGSVGFILNKPVLTDFNTIIQTDNNAFNLWFGGPVKSDFIYFIHTCGPDILPGSLPIADGIFWGGDFNLVTQKIGTGEINESAIRFFIGYSGWDNGQLEKEISEKYWMVNILDPKIVMDTKADIWKEAIKKAGKRYCVWENIPPNPMLN